MGVLTPQIAGLIVQSFSGEVNQDGVYEGPGSAEYHSGHKYVGQFRDGMLDGTGTYRWFDGMVYEGEFRDNKIAGVGMYKWPDGCVYEGQVSNGLRHGRGRFNDPERGSFYDGEWLEGRPNGQGHLQYDEQSHYKDGKREGFGVMFYRSGNVYEGEWKGGVKHGRGRMVWYDRSEEYDGEWKGNKPSGTGIYTWRIKALRNHQFPMQNRYEGCWQDGKRNGRGVFQYASGAIYEGEWRDDMKHGHGRYVSETGREYVGEFVNDRPTDTPYTFALSFGGSGGSDSDMIKEVHTIIFRHIVVLRKVYQHYSQMAPINPANPKCVVTREATWRLLKDMRIVELGFTLGMHFAAFKRLKCADALSARHSAELNRAYAREFRNHAFLAERYDDPHNSTEIFLLRDFLEFLMIISHHVYRKHPALSIHEHGIAATFSFAIKNNVIPYGIPITDGAKRPATNQALFRTVLGLHMRDAYGKEIERIYVDLSCRHANALPGSCKDKTLSVRESSYKIFGAPGSSITTSFVIEQFTRMIPLVRNGLSYNLEYEIMYMDLFDVLLAIGIESAAEALHETDKILGTLRLPAVEFEAQASLAFDEAREAIRAAAAKCAVAEIDAAGDENDQVQSDGIDSVGQSSHHTLAVAGTASLHKSQMLGSSLSFRRKTVAGVAGSFKGDPDRSGAAAAAAPSEQSGDAGHKAQAANPGAAPSSQRQQQHNDQLQQSQSFGQRQHQHQSQHQQEQHDHAQQTDHHHQQQDSHQKHEHGQLEHQTSSQNPHQGHAQHPPPYDQRQQSGEQQLQQHGNQKSHSASPHQNHESKQASPVPQQPAQASQKTAGQQKPADASQQANATAQAQSAPDQAPNQQTPIAGSKEQGTTNSTAKPVDSHAPEEAEPTEDPLCRVAKRVYSAVSAVFEAMVAAHRERKVASDLIEASLMRDVQDKDAPATAEPTSGGTDTQAPPDASRTTQPASLATA
ncbi:hypothetical protein HK105_206704 [Polyrhizophydium stewartii]|uniref:Uncharacterized protein n=1 Tax=Polyrhizophydium stewartii TaxID=2732419 RepID=A0ABR4N2T3_9FUNG